MTKKEEFKEFVKLNPEFAYSVKNGKTTWQELYQIYDLYGKESNLFDQYRKTKVTDSIVNNLGVKDIVNSLKNINIDVLQENLNGLGKAVSFIEDLTNTFKRDEKKAENESKKKGRVEPINRFFDD